MQQQATLTLKEDYIAEASVRDFTFTFDEPADKGGKDTGPTPTEMVCAALAACTSITLKMYANRKQWQIDNIDVTVNLLEKSEFQRIIKVSGSLDAKQKERIIAVANACPVHKLLEGSQKVITSLDS